MLLNSPSSHHFLLLLLLTFSSYTPCHPSLLPSDARALMDFKSHADPHNKLKFNPALTHCKWAGVHCGSGARVTRLVFEHLGLAGGFVHDSLTRLDQLRVLSLQNNSLSGPIPDLSGLVNLKSLFLGFNLFSGEFPPSILSLHRLRTLDLSRNNLTGELPSWLTRMDRLYTIKLEFNRFNGSIPAFNQSTLLFFNATGNNLSGPIPVTPVMTQFKPSSFALNPALCGEIIHKECHSKRPFFGVMTPPVASPVAPPPRTHVGLGQNEQMHGVELAQPRGGHHKSVAVILGFSVGVLVLIGSLLCFIMGVRKQRSGTQMGGQQGMAGDEVVQAAEAVKRAEEEVEEKVKSAQQQGIKGAAKSGSLVFCAGEAQLYTMEQLMRASAELIGRGTLGSTYKAVLDNRLIVCVKRLDGSKFMGAGKDGFERHMEAVGGLRHPNLVALRAYFQAAEERLLVYDYQPNGSVFSLIHGSKSSKAKPLHWTSCLKIAEDVAQGLSYIHQAWRLVHGNLKSTNVLLGSDFEACLTDYSLSLLADPAVFEDDPDSSGYWAPELRKPDSQATSKSDVYAFGVLLLELLTGKAPSEHPYLTPNDIVKWVRLTRDGEVSGSEENELAMLLEVAIACSVASPEQRPNMWQVLKMLQQIKEAVLIEENELGFDRSEGNVS